MSERPPQSVRAPSAEAPRLADVSSELAYSDEAHFAEIDAALLYLEEARARTERAVATLRGARADEHLVRALEDTQERISEARKQLMQGTFFAVPSAQASL